jgi:hypothetical protein
MWLGFGPNKRLNTHTHTFAPKTCSQTCASVRINESKNATTAQPVSPPVMPAPEPKAIVKSERQGKFKICIYVLCPTDESLVAAKAIYPYWWAYPIRLNNPMNQDFLLMENNFWYQAQSLEKEWSKFDYVGTISHSAHKKIIISELDAFLSRYNHNHQYVCFAKHPSKHTNVSDDFQYHPNFKEGWTATCEATSANPVIQPLVYNYWMCATRHFKPFLLWMCNLVIPVVKSIPLNYGDANYEGLLEHGKLVKLWGKPYYPLGLFILERFSFQFFRYMNVHL